MLRLQNTCRPHATHHKFVNLQAHTPVNVQQLEERHGVRDLEPQHAEEQQHLRPLHPEQKFSMVMVPEWSV